jgi:glycosyltransferase involved in cell wall biosynthesis
VQASRRVRLCVSVWSDGPRKNWPLLAALDASLDHSKYALTLVGRLPEGFALSNRTRHIPPLPQAALGALLRTMDIFIAPSYNECFSNAESQALGCGLPVLALDDSSHREVVARGGRFFAATGGVDAALRELAALVAGYPHYVTLAAPNDIDDVALQYLIAAGLV